MDYERACASGEATRKALREEWITIEEITEPDPGEGA